MKYKLYNGSTQDINNITDCVLRNRGIRNPHKYLHLDSSCLHDSSLFENMDKAIQMYNKHLDNHSTIAVLCDTDVDGYVSCTEIICYTKDVYSEADIHYVIHERPKAHGLENLDFILPEGCKLLIVPDAGTNDVSIYKEFNKNGIDVLILDHHEVEKEAMEYIKEDHSDEEFTTVIVNNQIGNYPNKNLSGAGVVYKFLQAYDSEFWLDYSEKYIDLCALGNIGDCMDLREEETRYLCDKGLENIQNPFFLSVIKQREFSMGGEININNIQFFIVPLINGCIRVGSQEEKELMLRAFIGENETFEYKKKATKDKPAEVINEDLPTRSARLASNAKARQDKLRDKYTTELCEIVADEITDEDRVVMVNGENIDSSLTGVIAIKLAEKFNMPCIIMKNHYDKNGNLDYIGGSARNVDNSPIDSFKDVVNSCKYASGQGHPSAFGNIIELDRVEETRLELNEKLKDIVYDSTYRVDYIFDEDDISVPLVYEFDKLKNIVAQGVDEPLIAIIMTIPQDKITVQGKKEDSLKWCICDETVNCVYFNCKYSELYNFAKDFENYGSKVKIEIVGTPQINVFNGIKTPQIKVKDVNIIEINHDIDDIWGVDDNGWG